MVFIILASPLKTGFFFTVYPVNDNRLIDTFDQFIYGLVIHIKLIRKIR